jgi:hypothetical protein
VTGAPMKRPGGTAGGPELPELGLPATVQVWGAPSVIGSRRLLPYGPLPLTALGEADRPPVSVTPLPEMLYEAPGLGATASSMASVPTVMPVRSFVLWPHAVVGGFALQAALVSAGNVSVPIVSPL